MDSIRKYPRTQHLEGSGLQKGDDPDRMPFVLLREKFLVVEEKLDGANTGISFDERGALQLQCRGHYLTGGPGEAQFALLKPWAQTHQGWLWERLGTRHILYGEWLYACHTVFYDRLPHYFFEFDILDTHTDCFLSTEKRREILAGGPVVSVPVLKEGIFRKLTDITKLVGPSLYKSDGGVSEGLYLKWEENGEVKGRYKFVRAGFLQTILDSGSHWKDRPLVPNQLAEGVDLW
ncbi:MAG: RNA ligase family protein [Armatimonadetes bacterium]|nr:RNA ligase family protein [Armatimonadota bacterium]